MRSKTPANARSAHAQRAARLPGRRPAHNHAPAPFRATPNQLHSPRAFRWVDGHGAPAASRGLRVAGSSPPAYPSSACLFWDGMKLVFVTIDPVWIVAEFRTSIGRRNEWLTKGDKVPPLRVAS